MDHHPTLIIRNLQLRDNLSPAAGGIQYVSVTGLGDYAAKQLNETSPGGLDSSIQTPFPERLGVFRTDPLLWVGRPSDIVVK